MRDLREAQGLFDGTRGAGGEGAGFVSRSSIATLYNRFTEGFDTQDLKDVKALPEELA
jgi:hypothetical protein